MLRPIITAVCCCTALFIVEDVLAAKPIQAKQNIDYVPSVDYSDNRDKLDVYLPKVRDNNPVLVHFHGGGLTFGSKEKGSKAFAETFAQLGLCVVAPNYRLAPEHLFPAQMLDAVKAIKWAVQHMQSYGCDTSNIVISGHSAGAYLAALLAVDEQWLSKLANLRGNIQGVVAISPLLELSNLNKTHLEQVWGTDKHIYRSASVTSHIEQNKLPMLLMYADNDHPGMDKEIQQFAQAMFINHNHVQVIEAMNRDHKSIINQLLKKDDVVKSSVMGWISLLNAN
ncbi:alpha/beta hydrolase fold domain-containing protein [Paraglaciecola arctica]|uniref:alpha/beta hydrolase fold domain-containing protein n=1 Tax=Paraglaciecola arctica TaxID=1128911 RepID=UPI001C069722|nr:alpha/beta hydrolase [Paraglaciecola arctica]MBU3005282.1 alpha/beta hydrolase [Paraglaciecola arctica]